MKLRTIIIVILIMSIIDTFIGTIYVLYRSKPAMHYWFTGALSGYGLALVLFLFTIIADNRIKMKSQQEGFK